MAANRTKAGKPFRIPLAEPVIKLLNEQPRQGDFVFCGGRRGKPLSNMAMLKMMRSLRGMGSTVHGLRSSFKDWSTERGFADEISETALDHRSGGGRREPLTRVPTCSSSAAS
jgi:integrase